MVQFCLVTSISLTASTVISWGLLTAAMAVPYVFADIVVSLAWYDPGDVNETGRMIGLATAALLDAGYALMRLQQPRCRML